MKESTRLSLKALYNKATYWALIFVTCLLYALGALVAFIGFIVFLVLGAMFIIENYLEVWRKEQGGKLKKLR